MRHSACAGSSAALRPRKKHRQANGGIHTMAQTVLVGSTAALWGQPMAAHTFDAAYHSTDVAEGFGCRNELVVYAGCPQPCFWPTGTRQPIGRDGRRPGESAPPGPGGWCSSPPLPFTRTAGARMKPAPCRPRPAPTGPTGCSWNSGCGGLSRRADRAAARPAYGKGLKRTFCTTYTRSPRAAEAGKVRGTGRPKRAGSRGL